MTVWFRANEERLAWELDCFKQAGYRYVVDEIAQMEGVLKLDVEVSIAGRNDTLTLEYPTGFPSFRPVVYKHDVILDRHQNPWGKNLCVVPNGDEGWEGGECGAHMVTQAIKLLEATVSGTNALQKVEVDAPEPASAHFRERQEPKSAFLFHEDLLRELHGPGSWGRFAVRATDLSRGGPKRAVLTEFVVVETAQGELERRIAISEAIKRSAIEAFGASPTIRGHWIQVDSPPPFTDWNSIVLWAKDQCPRAFRGGNEALARELIGIIFPDEGPTRGNYQPNWLLIHSTTVKDGKGKRVHRSSLRPYLVSVEGYDRIPTSSSLREKRVLLVGLGSLGSTCAVELCRAGLGNITMYDPDVVSPSNLVRHQADLRDVGLAKTDVVARKLSMINPAMLIERRPYPVGIAEMSDPQAAIKAQERLENDVQAADLILVTTGEAAPMRLMNQLAVEYGKPCVFTWVQSGAWGGHVFRTLPGCACYECKDWWGTEDKALSASEPEDTGPVYNQGCGMPSFVGLGFDITSVAMAATRLSVQTLVADNQVYPDLSGNHLVLNLRGQDASFTPHFKIADYARHPRCRLH